MKDLIKKTTAVILEKKKVVPLLREKKTVVPLLRENSGSTSSGQLESASSRIIKKFVAKARAKSLFR
jgi:hypothetical protein